MLTPVMQPILQPVMANLDYYYGDNFSPAALFTTGKKGFWYKPNDVSTIYQDNSGSTTVSNMLCYTGSGNTDIVFTCDNWINANDVIAFNLESTSTFTTIHFEK